MAGNWPGCAGCRFVQIALEADLKGLPQPFPQCLGNISQSAAGHAPLCLDREELPEWAPRRSVSEEVDGFFPRLTPRRVPDAEVTPIQRLLSRPLDRATYLTVRPALRNPGRFEAVHMLEVYPDMVRLRVIAGDGNRRMGGGRRGRVQGKSAAARRRQLQLMARVKPRGRVYFVTLTYSDEYWYSWEAWKRDLHTLFKRMARLWPEFGALWALELVERKSGYRLGEWAPHFHLILFGVDVEKVEDGPDEYQLKRDGEKASDVLRLQAWFKRNWYEVNHIGAVGVVGKPGRYVKFQVPVPEGEESEVHINRKRGADVVELDSRRKIYSYVSKYTSKAGPGMVDDVGEVLDTGRTWGYRGAVPLHPGYKIPLGEEDIITLKRMIKRWLKARRWAVNQRKINQWAAKNAERVARGKPPLGAPLLLPRRVAYAEWFARLPVWLNWHVLGFGLEMLGGEDEGRALARLFMILDV